VVQTPVYPPFLEAVAECRRVQFTNELVRGAERYEIDFDALRAAGPRTRMLMLCHPQNPTGRAFTRAELVRLAELALERDWIVVSDEIHADLVYPPAVHVPFAALGPEIGRQTITLTSATKAFNIAGLRCAVAHFGSEPLQRRFNALPRHVRGGIESLGLHATELAWTRCQPWLDEVLRYLEGNRERVARFVRERLPGVRMLPPEATYLAWLDCRELGLASEPQRFFLDKARVALSRGAAFGQGGVGFVRLNFATSRAILAQILERMAAALGR
jgi:cystathionine beta-lyase